MHNQNLNAGLFLHNCWVAMPPCGETIKPWKGSLQTLVAYTKNDLLSYEYLSHQWPRITIWQLTIVETQWDIKNVGRLMSFKQIQNISKLNSHH